MSARILAAGAPNRMRRLVGMALAALTVAGCGQPPEAEIAYSLHGRLSSTTVNASGRRGYVKLVGPGEGIQSPARYETVCALVGPSCDYRLGFVREDEYTFLAFIDMNGNCSLENPTPDSGDLLTAGIPLLLFDDTVVNVTDDAWRSLP